MLTEMSFAELVEEESNSNKNTFGEDLKGFSPAHNYNKHLASFAISKVHKAQFLTYTVDQTDPHILEIDAPPPDQI